MLARRKLIRLSLRKKLLFAFVSTALFFLLIEAILFGLGVEPQSAHTDRMVGFSSYSPLMVEAQDDSGEVFLTTAPNKLHWFNEQHFPKRKAAGTIRIFCMGGSTTYGHPYWDETSFAGWLRKQLPIVDPEHRWEVINAGGISYASYRVSALMDELAQYEPDMFIVYSAHNEFLERRTYSNMFDQPALARDATALMSKTRIWTVAERVVSSMRSQPKQSVNDKQTQLPAEVDEELNHTIGPVDYHRDDVWKSAVVKHYRENLEQMIATAKRCGAKIVFVTPAVNEKDCAPFKSELTKSDSAAQATMEALILNGTQALDQSQLDAARDSFSQASKLDERFAEAHYRLGRTLLELGNKAEAAKEFRTAIDEDICPLRAVTEIDRAVREVALKNSVPVVDFERRLRELAIAQTGSSIFGQELFMDHVHPTIEVNRQLSIWIIDELQRQKLIAGKPLTDAEIESQLNEVRQSVLASIHTEDDVFALRNLAKVIHWSGKFDEALLLARDVLELASGDAESRYIVASCLANMGKTEAALEEYAILFADGIGFPRAYLSYGELLAANGHYEQAKAYLMLAILNYPDNAEAYASLGKVHQALGEEQFAKEAFANAERLRRKS